MPNQPVRIFIVDAHPLVSEHLTGLLEQQPGWKVCGHAVDFENGLSGIRNLLPDLVLMEPSLRSEHGVDFIRALKGAHPNVLMVVFSMREEDQDVEQTLGAGAHGYVTKREPTAQVIAAIRHVMAGRIYISPKTVERRPDRAMRRTPPPGEPFSALSDREREVFVGLGHGHAVREIAARLNLSIKTVQTHCARIKCKLGLPSGRQLVREAIRWIEREKRREA